MKISLIAALAVCLLASMTMEARDKSSGFVDKTTLSYDARRDPARDLQAAIAEATKTHKRILLEVGGDWCVYCNIMDQTFASHPSLQKVRDDDFVTVKVNYSQQNPNQEFLSKYPKIPDYPHFFVLDSKGAFLYSQPTHPFEHGRSYNVGKIDAFLKRWGQPERHWLNLNKVG